MSVNSNKISVYSSPQIEQQIASQTETTDPTAAESRAYHVPKRTTYRVKISNSKDLETLSTAAKLGLTSWVGGQKVRIVGVAKKQVSEFAAVESNSLAAGENVNGSVKGSFAPYRAKFQCASGTNGIYSAASGKPTVHPAYSTASVVGMTDSASCTLSTSCNTDVSQCIRFTTCTPYDLCRTSRTSQCQPSGSLKATADTAVSSRHCRNGSLNSLVKPWSQYEYSLCSSVLHSLPHGVHYVGTVAVTSCNVTANSTVEDSNTRFFSQNVADAAVISAVKRFSETINGNKQLNSKKLTPPTVGYIKNNHVQYASKNHNQRLNQSQNSSASCLKRPFVDDDETRTVSRKRMADSVPCYGYLDYFEASNFSDATNSASHRQPLTSNMLNHVAARSGNCDQHAGHNNCSAIDTVKNDMRTVEVNNNCTSQQMLLSNLVPTLRLPSGSGMLLLILYCLVIVS